jgi:hypothetical protein
MMRVSILKIEDLRSQPNSSFEQFFSFGFKELNRKKIPFFKGIS